MRTAGFWAPPLSFKADPMTEFNGQAALKLANLPLYIDRITDRLTSFQSQMTQEGDAQLFQFPWGTARLRMPEGELRLEASAETADGLARLKDILATAVELYARDDRPEIIWQGDLTDRGLSQFRLARVLEVQEITPHVRRIRLAADNLARFENFGGMHIRLLLPTDGVADPVWPEQGENGLPLWPDADRKPVARVYTIRNIDVAAGHFDIDMVIHAEGGPGSSWALRAQPGMQVGVMGPLGRPVPVADRYIMGADETGIPAIARMLDRLPQSARGTVLIEVGGADEVQSLPDHAGFEVRWIYRNGVAPGCDRRLVDAVCGIVWDDKVDSFGWFAAEAGMAKIVRDYWRNTLGFDRTKTLVAGYWRIGAAGVMAG